MGKQQQSKYTAQAKSKFLVDMSYEIQNSMKHILSHSDHLKRTDLSAKQIEYVDTIYQSAKKLTWIVNDILDFSQLESGRVVLQNIDFNLKYLINDIFRKTVEQKKDHPVDTYIDIAEDVPCNLLGDPTRLRQVLANLLSNAFKFTLEGEIGIVVENVKGKATKSTGKSKSVNLRIIVKDTGRGITEDRLSTIFDLQSQGDPSRSWEFGGTGLGLTICKLIVETMGGVISVQSEVDKGSKFIVDLAFGVGDSPRERNVHPLAKEELVGKKAIIIDDNEIARKILKKCCETLGMKAMLISASPKAVLQMLNDLTDDEENPDLILCDIMMPEMDGYELMRRIRANKKLKNIKSVAVTSAVQVGSAHSAQESGFDGFLPKPVFLDELAKVITTVLGDARDQKTIVTRHMAEEIKYAETKILIIEDKGLDQDLVEECLGVLDCERDFVSNGHEAIEHLKEKIYDISLIDFNVLEDEGAEIVRTIKEVSQDMPIIALLPSDDKRQRTECLDAGMDDFIIKPVDVISLKRIVKRYGKN